MDTPDDRPRELPLLAAARRIVADWPTEPGQKSTAAERLLIDGFAQLHKEAVERGLEKLDAMRAWVVVMHERRERSDLLEAFATFVASADQMDAQEDAGLITAAEREANAAWLEEQMKAALQRGWRIEDLILDLARACRGELPGMKEPDSADDGETQ